MNITVSEFIVRYLERIGVEHVFGMPGAHILPVYDALFDSNVATVLAKHEQGAAFMAGGYNRVSGKISGCIATAGPGATNLVTGIANAYADKQPLVVITGETSTHIFGKGGLQESSGEGGAIDQVAMFKGITRYARLVERADYLPQVLNQITRILFSDSPGPVLISIPFNVQSETIGATLLDSIKTTRSTYSLHDDCVPEKKLLQLIREANAPVVIAGHGVKCSGAEAMLAEFSQRFGIPVATSLKGKGVMDESHPLSLGTLGVTSNGCAFRYLVEDADLMLVLGAGFNERTSYLWEKKLQHGKKIVQVDNDYEQLDKVLQADIAVHGDIKGVLERLLERYDENLHGIDNRAELYTAISTLKKETTQGEGAIVNGNFPVVKHFFSRLAERFASNVVIFDDNIIFAQNFFPVATGGCYFPNSGVSSLGQAIPAAIGARFIESKPTFAVLGDGGFQMCCMELMTAVNYQLPINVVMFNNATMGLIRKNQAQRYNKRYLDCDFVNPDYGLLARSFGIRHFRIESKPAIDELFEQADFSNDSNLIEIVIDKDTFPNYQSGR